MRKIVEHDSLPGLFMFSCPGCGHDHCCYTKPHRWYDADGNPHDVPVWGFNGNLEQPTFTPSLLNTRKFGDGDKQERCHLYVTDGKIAYCGDCTHSLAGQTVDMIDFDRS